MKVAFYLTRPESTSPTSIYCRISYQGNRLKYYIPESIGPAYWNGKTIPHRAKQTAKFPQYPEFNKRLDNIENTIKNTIRKFSNDNDNKLPSPEVLKQLLDVAIKHDGQVQRESFMSFFEKFIKDSEEGIRLTKRGKPITVGTIKTYHTTKSCLENYQQYSRRRIDFDTIDMEFYNDFTRYLTTVIKQSTNYIGKHIKVIKTILQEATELNINSNLAFKARGFTTISEEADAIYLTEAELHEMQQLDLRDSPRLERARDLFLIGCHTGLRYSDLSTLHPAQIADGYIRLTQNKTGDEVVIPVHDTVITIMEKYNGELPPALSNQKTNAALKEVAQQCTNLRKPTSVKFTKGGVLQTNNCERWELVTTHTARRSFATNQYLNGIPTITIMAITGHKTEKAFMKYIKITPDSHAKIMKAKWEENKQSSVILAV